MNWRCARSLLSSYALFTFFTCSAPAGELNVAHLSSYIDVGYGYNPVIGEIYTPCIKPSGSSTDEQRGPVETFSENIKIKQIASTTELKTATNLNVYAAAFTPTVTFNADMQKLLQTTISQEKTYFYISVVAEGFTKPLRMPFELTPAAIQALTDGESAFKKYCGDSYVAALRGGGEFSALLTTDRLTNEELKKFYSKLDVSARGLSGGGKLGAEDSSYFSNFSSEKHLTIEIAQTGNPNESLPSLTDVSALLEYARTFAQRLKASGGFAPSTAVYAKYSSSVEFGGALKAASKQRFINLDLSTQYMTEIVGAFDASTDALALVRDALSNPSEYKKFDEGVARDQEKALARQRDEFATLARNCAETAARGENCEVPTSLVVRRPTEIVRLESCTIASFRERYGSLGNTCNVVARSGEACRCTECTLFQQTQYNLNDGNDVENICVGMKPNASVYVSVSTRVRINPEATAHGLVIYLQSQPSAATPPTWKYDELFSSGSSGPANDILRSLEERTSPSGDFRAKIGVGRCYSNAQVRATCTFEKLSPAANGLLSVREK